VDLTAPQLLSDEERTLLLKIARCPLVAAASQNVGHPCHEVVAVQSASEDMRQVPEGWAGNLRDARVAFLSSNPGISEQRPDQPPGTAEAYPVASCPDEHIAKYLGRRFDQTVAPQPFVRDFRHLQIDGQYAAKRTPYWVSMRLRAAELLGPGADPAVNYVMTEIVHCKSKNGERCGSRSRHLWQPLP
jgi:hypothetical protein